MHKPSMWRSKTGAFIAVAIVLASQLAQAGSLWKKNTSRALVSDKRASQVGDILTIIVQESNSNKQENSTTTGRDADISAGIESIFYSPQASGFLTHNGELPAMNMSSSKSFSGGGKINNSKQMSARVAVRVIDVLPRGQLLVEGRRVTEFSGEKQIAVLQGVVRLDDVTSMNTVLSHQVADATIYFMSSGTLTDSQRKGWFHRVWDKVAPF